MHFQERGSIKHEWSNWILKKNGGFLEVYSFVGVPDGI
jgi:hypothetical protein